MFILLVTLIANAEGNQKNKTNKIKATQKIKNRLINYNGFRKIVLAAEKPREKMRLTEKEFLKAMKSKQYILLDARSAAKFKLRHIKGAINLPFTEFTEKTLTKVIPDKNAKILIYCNNNFKGSPIAFPGKAPIASLNISTQMSLRAYKYHNIYELGPLLNVENTILPFEGTEVKKKIRKL